MVTDEHSRGQVILIAAIALAFIILGVVVVFNGVLYTETISSSSTSQATADAELTEHELETALRNMSEQQGDWESNEFATAVDEFGGLYQQTKANSRSASVNVELEGDDVIIGTGSEIEEDTIDIEDEIDYLELNLEGGGNVTVNANATVADFDANVSINETDGGAEYELEDDDGNTCSIAAEAVWVDLKTGMTRAGDDCSSLDLIEADEEYQYIEIETDGGPDGSYAYAYGTMDPGDVLAVTLEYTYESNDVSIHDEEKEIKIYGGES